MRYIKNISVPRSSVKSSHAFDGEGFSLSVMKNVSDRCYPSITPRGKRAVLGKYGKIAAFLPDEIPVRIENGRFYIGQTQVSEEYIPENFRHTVLRLGEFFTVIPYGLFFHATDHSLYGSMRKSFYMGAQGVEVATVDANMNVITEYTPLRTRIPAAEEGELWAKPREEGGYEMQRYDGQEWRPYESYVRLKSSSLGSSFRVGDVLECTGADHVLPRYMRVTHSDAEGICFAGATPHVEKIDFFSIKRPIPFLQQSLISNGRAVGVYSGYGENGEFISRVYASALNDPLCWSEYGGALSADIGGSETFNAIVNFDGDILAFRENSIVRIHIYEEKISFSVIECEGVALGAEKSVAVIGKKVYYKSPSAICVFDGTAVKRIPSSFGKLIYDTENGTPAAAYNGKYYVSLKDGNGKRAIYVYNPESRIWCVEDDPGVNCFINVGGTLLAVCNTEGGSTLMLWDYDSAGQAVINRFSSEGYPVYENTVSWSFESGTLGADVKKGMRPSRVYIRAELRDGATLGVGLIYCGRGTPESVVNISDGKSGYFEIPMRAVKDGMPRIAVYGKGDAEIFGYDVEYVSDKA